MNVTVTSAAAANATSTSIVGAANPQVVRGFAFTATVQSMNNKRGGNVVFRDGDSILATVPLDDMGSVVYSSASLGPGVHYIRAAYSGTIGLAGSVSSVLVETIPAEVPDFSMTRRCGGGAPDVRLQVAPEQRRLRIAIVQPSTVNRRWPSRRYLQLDRIQTRHLMIVVNALA